MKEFRRQKEEERKKFLEERKKKAAEMAKLKQDIPLFAELDISVLSEDAGFERKNIFLSIGTDYLINLNSIEQRPLANGEETQDANSA